MIMLKQKLELLCLVVQIFDKSLNYREMIFIKKGSLDGDAKEVTLKVELWASCSFWGQC